MSLNALQDDWYDNNYKRFYKCMQRKHIGFLRDNMSCAWQKLNRTMPANCQRRIHSAVLLQWSVVMKS